MRDQECKSNTRKWRFSCHDTTSTLDQANNWFSDASVFGQIAIALKFVAWYCKYGHKFLRESPKKYRNNLIFLSIGYFYSKLKYSAPNIDCPWKSRKPLFSVPTYKVTRFTARINFPLNVSDEKPWDTCPPSSSLLLVKGGWKRDQMVRNTSLNHDRGILNSTYNTRTHCCLGCKCCVC